MRKVARPWLATPRNSAIMIAALTMGAAFALRAQSSSPAPPAIVSEGNASGSDACAACHGSLGEGSPDGAYPRLAGLNAGYLNKQLRDYRSGSRRNPVMEPIAYGLSDEEANRASLWFASAEPHAAPPARRDAQLIARGAILARDGAWDRGIPPCASCHGATGLGAGSAFPALAGQSAPYLERQIHAWRLGWRRNDPMGLMKGVANSLTGPELRAAAAYYASLPPPVASREGKQ